MDYSILEQDNYLIVDVDADSMEFKMDEILKDISGTLIEKTWHSKHNNYVVAYKPFVVGGYTLRYIVNFVISSKLKEYYRYEIEKQLRLIDSLNKILLLECKV